MKQHIIISGGSRGLGMALVGGLLKSGYNVSTFSRKATEFTRDLDSDVAFFFAEADVSDSSQTGPFVEAAVAKF